MLMRDTASIKLSVRRRSSMVESFNSSFDDL